MSDPHGPAAPAAASGTRTEAALDEAISRDAFLGGALMLRQPRDGHRAGHDAILLAAAVPALPQAHVVDFGAGVGTVGLAVARRLDDVRVTLVEREAHLVALAQDNIASNDLTARVRVTGLDVEANAAAFAQAGLPAGCADIVAMNPPFNHHARHQTSPDASRAAAHEADDQTLALWLKAARRVLKPDGVVVLIWRAEDVSQVLDTFAIGFGGIELCPIHAMPQQDAIRIVARARRDSRAPLRLRPALVLNDEARMPSLEAQAILRHGSALFD